MGHRRTAHCQVYDSPTNHSEYEEQLLLFYQRPELVSAADFR
jgi:hypothetical protein